MKRNRALVFLAAACAFVAALVLLDRHRPSTDDQARASERILPAFDRAAATEIAVERQGVTTLLRHQSDGWWQIEPRRRRADDAAVDTLLAVLEYGQVERRIATVDGALAHTLGLDRPRVVVRVGGHTLAVGGDDPARGVYLRRDGEKGALVAEHRLVEAADLDPRLWMSMRLVLDDPAQASRIAWGDWSLGRRANCWLVEKPLVTRAAPAKIDALVQSLSRVRALREVPAPMTEEGGQEGGVALKLDDVVEARVVGACSDAPNQSLVARADGAWLCVATSDLDLLRAPPTTYYERRLFPFRVDDVTSIAVGRTFELRRTDGVWRFTKGGGVARDEAVRAWLEPLLAAEVRDFTAAPLHGVATEISIQTRDDGTGAFLAGAQARRVGDTVTLELAAPLSPSTDAATLRGSL
jgi:hypothetical protein